MNEVSEKDAAAEELLRAKELLEALYKSSPDMIFLHGPDGSLVDVNDNTLRRYGFTRHEMLSLPFDRFIAEDPALKPPRELLQRAMAGDALDFEYLGRTRDGEVFPIEVRLRRLSEKAAPASVLAVVRDISARRRSEEILRRRTRDLNQRVKELNCLYDISRLMEAHQGSLDDLFRQVVERLPAGFQFPEWTAVRLRVGGQEYCSPGFQASSTRIGITLAVPDEPKGRIEAFFVGDKERETFLPEESSLLSVVREQIERVVERRHAEEHLRKSRAQLVKAQRLAHLGSWEWHIVSGELTWSEETYALFGLAVGSAIDYPRFLDFIHPEDRELVDATVGKAVAELAPYHVDHRIIRTDGELRYVHEEGTIIFDDEGQPSRMVGVVQDITGRKSAEDQLRKSYVELRAAHQRLKEMNAQLIQSEKMASIGQLAAGVAHEINNPVGYISSNVGTLQSYMREMWELIDLCAEAEGHLDHPELAGRIAELKQRIDLPFLRADVDDLISETKEGVQRVKSIVQDLKDFSRVEEEEWQWADLHRGIDSTLNIVWNELKYKAEVLKEYGDLPEVECMPSQLNQVFMNLLVNAGHAIGEAAGGRGTITIRSGVEGDEVWVAVSDTGCGIDAEHLNRLFDPFFTTKPVGKGTGLGLALSYSIVAKHHGRIEVDTEPGRGSTFTVWLPVQQSRKEDGGLLQPV